MIRAVSSFFKQEIADTCKIVHSISLDRDCSAEFCFQRKYLMSGILVPVNSQFPVTSNYPEIS